MADDTRLLREQVERCRVILSKLTSLDEKDGGFLERMTLGHLVEEVVGPQRPFDIAIEASCRGEGPEPVCMRSPGLLYALGNLVDNAVDFATHRIVIDARWSAAQVSVEIRDDGPGFPPDVLLRAGEPYVTTRGSSLGEDGAGSGLGLGLFIAKTLIERSGGQLALFNAERDGEGAVARITWPRATFEPDDAYLSEGSSAAHLSAPESVTI